MVCPLRRIFWSHSTCNIPNQPVLLSVYISYAILSFLYQVVVIDKGVIAEQGTHDELVNINGVYKRLVLKQLEAGGQNKPLDESD